MLSITTITSLVSLLTVAHAQITVALTDRQLEVNQTEIAVMQVVDQPITLEKYVRDYFADTPILAEISKCESRFHQLADSGRIFRGEQNREDVGLMQINEAYHLKTAKALGYDIYSVEGNLAFGQYLYERDGVQAWSASSGCWKKSEAFKQLALKD